MVLRLLAPVLLLLCLASATDSMKLPVPLPAVRAAAQAAAAKLAGRPLVLGSTSSTRRALLAALDVPHRCDAPSIDERAVGDRGGDAAALVMAVAHAKADALQRSYGAASDVLLLTGDQVVVRGSYPDGAREILEKPSDLDQCRAFMRAHGTQGCATVGACVLTDCRTGQRWDGVDVANIRFSALPDDVVEAMIAKDGNTLLQCAGGVMIEHDLLQPCVLLLLLLRSLY